VMFTRSSLRALRLASLSCAGLTLCAFALPAQQAPVVLQNATVFTGSGPATTNGYVVFQGGRITALGSGEAKVPGARVIDVQGAWITPGLVDPNTSLGLPSAHENEESDEITPQIQILDAVDPESSDFVDALENGVTTVYVAPGGNNVFGGLGVVLKSAGDGLRSRIVKRESGLKVTIGDRAFRTNRAPRFGTPVSLYSRRPTTRMGSIWEVRNAFYKAMKRGSGEQVNMREDKLVVLRRALDKKLKVRMTAGQEHDIRTVLRLAAEFDLDVVLDGGSEAYYVLDYISAAKIPVVLTPPSLNSDGEGSRLQLDTAALLAKRGVPLALQTGQGTGALALVHEAAFAVRHGLPREVALAAITSVPARVLGVDDRVGTLAKDRDADIVVWSGHPLRSTTRVQHVFVEGRQVLGAEPGASSKKEARR
jgi:imidazolonepropionase-like amidohydrolase